MAKSKPQKAQKKSQRKRKQTPAFENERLCWTKMLIRGTGLDVRIAKLEELFDKLDEAVRKAKPLMSEKEALKKLYELRQQRAVRLLGR